MTNTRYAINFSDYFDIKDSGCDIIYNSNKIKDIFENNKLTVHPNNLDFKLIDLVNTEKERVCFSYTPGKPYFSYKNIPLELPSNVNEDVILHSRCGGGNGFLLFSKCIFLKGNVKNTCKQKMAVLQDRYLCIQIRNTDLKCDYIKLYNTNKEYIHSFNEIYICTDDKVVVEFYKSKKLNIHCFTTFPIIPSRNLHASDVPPSIKIQDLMVDIFMATNTTELLSTSKGGFIDLLRKCNQDKKSILQKLE